ncbi:hypothetical protein IQ65_21910 [Leptospira interrogans serovar Lai]|nr:hypothetical protein IQ65_21910 [Leptospira interrogans serovar Lai]
MSLKIKTWRKIVYLKWFLIRLRRNGSIKLIGKSPFDSFICVYLNHSYSLTSQDSKHLITLNLYYFTYDGTALKRLFFEFGLLGVSLDVSIILCGRVGEE